MVYPGKIAVSVFISLVLITACSKKQNEPGSSAPTPPVSTDNASRSNTGAAANAQDEKPADKSGKFFGAKMTDYPEWFKQSFLDINEDVKEAAAAGKRLMILFQQDGCPYCNALVERNIAQKHIADKLKKHFDIISLNMWGDREITYLDGKSYKEKNLAEMLKVQFTPTLFFYDEQGKVVLRINGYRSPKRFGMDLDFVALKKEKQSSYRAYIKANYKPGKASKEMNAQPFFMQPPYDLQRKSGKPLVVFFEQKDCPNCDVLHKNIIPDQSIQKTLEAFDVVQLDMWSKQTQLVTPQGKSMTARQWAKELDIKFAPSILVFNREGREVIRSEAFFKVFHTNGIMTYVLDEAYLKQPSFQRYLSDKADHLREQGKDVDIWRYSGEDTGERKGQTLEGTKL